MSTPNDTVWQIEPHTEAKHRLYEKYLQAWYPILLQSSKWHAVTYVEGFSGPGEYLGGEPGSPRIALRTARSCIRPPDAGKPARFLLIEKRPDRAGRLRALLAADLGVGDLATSRSAGFDVDVVTGVYQDHLLPLLDRHRAWDQPMFVVLDTWGSAVDFELLQRIAQSRAAEVVVTMQPIQFVRFAKDPTHYGDRVFGPVVWRDVQQQSSHAKADYIRQQYRRVVQLAGFQHVLDFELADERSNLLYLVFGTNSEVGLTKMKDAMWREDPFHGIGYRDPRDPDQQMLPIDPTPQTAPLRRLVLDHLANLPGQQATVEELKRFTLLGTIYKPSHTTPTVKSLIQEGALSRQPTNGRLIGSTTVRLLDQQLAFSLE